MELFVASDRPIESSHGWKKEPYLTVEELSEPEQAVSHQVSLPHVRFLGAHTGCSCGFDYGVGEAGSDAEREQEQSGRLSVAALRDFLETQLRAGVLLELFSCWAGEESRAPAEVLEVTPEYFGGDSFELPQGALLRVREAVEQ